MAISSAERKTNCARVLLALTKDWQAADGNAATLSDARAMLARTIYATDGQGFPDPASDETVKQGELQDAWKACIAAAGAALDDKSEPYEPYGSHVVFWTPDPANPGKLGEGLGLNWPIQPDSHVTRVSGPLLDASQGKAKRLFFFDAIAEDVAIEKDGGAGAGLWPRAKKTAPAADTPSAPAAKLPPKTCPATALFILWLLSGIGLALGMWCVGDNVRATVAELSSGACALKPPPGPASPAGASTAERPPRELADATGCAIAWATKWSSDQIKTWYGKLLGGLAWKVFGSGNSVSLVVPLIGTMLSMTILMLAAGLAWKGLWFGVLIDERNRLSMSRVQQVAWTILLLSGVTVMAWFNAALMGGPQAAQAGFELFPWMNAQLWAALGVNLAVSPMLSSAILNNKQRAAQGQSDLALRQFVRPAALDTNPPGQWSWLDLVTGETTETENQLDVGRIQHLIISGGLLTTYFMALIGYLDHISGGTIAVAVGSHGALFPSMPDVGSGTFVGLLALSHAGYLAFKARDGVTPGASTGGSSGSGGSTATGHT
jgi:hypothetical protein